VRNPLLPQGFLQRGRKRGSEVTAARLQGGQNGVMNDFEALPLAIQKRA